MIDKITPSQRISASEIDNAYDLLHAENQAKQAKIDALMLEYCPDDMTESQMKEFEKHQIGAGSGD